MKFSNLLRTSSHTSSSEHASSSSSSNKDYASSLAHLQSSYGVDSCAGRSAPIIITLPQNHKISSDLPAIQSHPDVSYAFDHLQSTLGFSGSVPVPHERALSQPNAAPKKHSKSFKADASRQTPSSGVLNTGLNNGATWLAKV